MSKAKHDDDAPKAAGPAKPQPGDADPPASAPEGNVGVKKPPTPGDLDPGSPEGKTGGDPHRPLDEALASAGAPLTGAPLTGTLPGAAPQPSRALFRVKSSITGGHEPGEVKAASEFKGADLDWLVRTGALEPVDARLHAVRPSDAELHDEVERLHAENDRLRAENDHLRDQWGKTPQAPAAPAKAQPAAAAPAGVEPAEGAEPPQPLGHGRHNPAPRPKT